MQRCAPVTSLADTQDVGSLSLSAMISLVDALPVAVLQVGADGLILYANPRAQALLRVQHPVLKGKNVGDVMAPLSRLVSEASEERAKVSLGDRVFGFQCVRVEDGTWMVAFQDITRFEETQRERNRLLQLASISDVMPAVLHELKNPLAAISTTLELLLEDTQATEYGGRVHAVLGEVRRLGLTLDGLGRFRHEVRAARYAAIDLAVREAFALLEPQAVGKGLSTRLQVEDMPLLPFEPAALRAVVFNLVTNAIHACAPGQQIGLEARFDRATQALVLVVADTGAGMTAEVKGRCTELFFTTKPKGSGIGLALCAGVAQAVGGTMTIDTEPGQGTRITMTFPLKPKEP